MKKQRIFTLILSIVMIFTIFTVASSAKLERYDLTSDQISYNENARFIVNNIIASIYGNTFSSFTKDSASTDYDQFMRQVTYFLRRDFVNDPVEKCLYELILNDITDHGNGKIVHLTATMDLYTANSEEPTVKTLDFFVKFPFLHKVLVATDVYVAENSLETLIFPEITPMTVEKFGDWADKTNAAEYAALAEKLKPETESVINHYERDIFKDIYHNQNENVSVKNTNIEAFEQATNFLNDYITCISEKKALETDVKMASEYVNRYLAAMTKFYSNGNKFSYEVEIEFIYRDGYAFENNIYLEVQRLVKDSPGFSSDAVYFRFIKQDDGTLALANYCENIHSFDTLVFDWNSYGDSVWFDSYIQDFKTIDYAQVIKRAERIADNGYFPSNTVSDANITIPVETPPTDPDIPDSEPAENNYLSNPTTTDISLIFYALAVISAILYFITFKKRA